MNELEYVNCNRQTKLLGKHHALCLFDSKVSSFVYNLFPMPNPPFFMLKHELVFLSQLY